MLVIQSFIHSPFKLVLNLSFKLSEILQSNRIEKLADRSFTLHKFQSFISKIGEGGVVKLRLCVSLLSSILNKFLYNSSFSKSLYLSIVSRLYPTSIGVFLQNFTHVEERLNKDTLYFKSFGILPQIHHKFHKCWLIHVKSTIFSLLFIYGRGFYKFLSKSRVLYSTVLFLHFYNLVNCTKQIFVRNFQIFCNEHRSSKNISMSCVHQLCRYLNHIIILKSNV